MDPWETGREDVQRGQREELRERRKGFPGSRSNKGQGPCEGKSLARQTGRTVVWPDQRRRESPAVAG